MCGICVHCTLLVQVVGSGCSYSHDGGSGSAGESREACLWLGVRHTHKQALQIFSREIAPAGTGMGETEAGVCGFKSHSMQLSIL